MQRLDEGGQLFAGDLVGAGGDGLDAPGDRPGDEPGEQGGEQHGTEGDGDAADAVGAGGVDLRFGAVHDRLADGVLEADTLADELGEGDVVERGDRAGLHGHDGHVEVVAEAGEHRSEAAVAVLEQPLLGGDRFELGDRVLEVGERLAGADERCDRGRVGLPGGDAGDHVVGGELGAGELEHREQLGAEVGVAGFGGEQLTDGDEVAAGPLVRADRVALADEHVGGEHGAVDDAAAREERGTGGGDVLLGGVGPVEAVDGGDELVERGVGGGSGLGEVAGPQGRGGGVVLGGGVALVGEGVGGTEVAHHAVGGVDGVAPVVEDGEGAAGVGHFGLDGAEGTDQWRPHPSELGAVLGLLHVTQVVAHREREQCGDRQHEWECGSEQLRRQC